MNNVFPIDLSPQAIGAMVYEAWRRKVVEWNATLLANYETASGQWLVDAQYKRAVGLPLLPTPVPPRRIGLRVKPDGFPETFDDGAIASQVELKPLPPEPPAGTYGPGDPVPGTSDWFLGQPGDTAETGTIVVKGASTYLKVGTPFGPYWRRVSGSMMG